MKYGQIAGNNSINMLIYHCFDFLCDEDERKFVKKFNDQPDDSDQIMHTFRELIIGAYLSSKGFTVKHDLTIDEQTPDWSILDKEGGAISGIVELTSFHIDKQTKNVIDEKLSEKGIAGDWRDGNKNNIDRLYQTIWHKAQVYKSLVEELKVPYVVGVFGEFIVALDFQEVRRCLLDEEMGLFQMYPGLSGVLYFQEASGKYIFNYAKSPFALWSVELPDGVFPRAA